MVQRYDIWMYYDEWQEDESDDGEWVKYDDHAAELATLRAENERLTAALMNPDMEVLESICCGRDAYASELADMLYSYWEALK